MTPPVLLTAENVPGGELAGFLGRVYPPDKVDFLVAHGAWWHESPKNQLLVRDGDELAGYCAVIPARVSVGNQPRDALWWIDLVVDARHRGRGLQTLFDTHVRGLSGLLLGFPNALAAVIHRKHGWSVREDLRMMLLPLRPLRVKPLRAKRGPAGLALRCAALALTPLAALWCVRLARMRADSARTLDTPTAELLAGVFERSGTRDINTTIRDRAHFVQRYFSAPMFGEFAFFTAGDPAAPSHYLVARHMERDGVRFTRILDCFGDFSDRSRLRDLVVLAVRDAVRRGSGQVTALVSLPELRPVFRSLGFAISVPVGFCWQCEDPVLASALAGRSHWTIADSDNDAPE